MRRPEQANESIAHHAAQFLARESNRESLITVTRSAMSPDYRHVTVFLSVIPESQAEKALAFAQRMRRDFREYLKKNTVMHPLPVVDFEMDTGEKNRQRVDELTRN
ncbi:MAG TPA: ribosome-binding factor A [Candidatus Paceibacterota bacterium]|jgi:ribosome-binding factor A|nr:ribosome-binding factor A [Candidatus Paceibacterota bacterium]